MKYVWDNDLHIHSQLSLCSLDPEQTPERILRYAKENGLKTIVLTDHCWNLQSIPSSDWYKYQTLEYTKKSLPLPQADGIRFLFGVETEMHKSRVIALNPEDYDELDFIVVPLTHFHMEDLSITLEEASSPQNKANALIERLDAFLNMDLPFRKIGLAHLTCGLIAKKREDYLKVLDLLPQNRLEELFAKAAKVGVGIELNHSDMQFADSEADTVLRMYKIAKNQGCKFYMGSDAHHPDTFNTTKAVYDRAIDLLQLTEDDKFYICGKEM